MLEKAEMNVLRQIMGKARTDHKRSPDIRQQRGIEIVQWVEEYTDRMKQPRITRGSQLDYAESKTRLS
jgi:hypothetical protein